MPRILQTGGGGGGAPTQGVGTNLYKPSDSYGTITPSGINIETTIFDSTSLISNPGFLRGAISLKNLSIFADQVTLKLYIKVDGVNWVLYDSKTYSGLISPALVDFGTDGELLATSGVPVKVTLTQNTLPIYSFNKTVNLTTFNGTLSNSGSLTPASLNTETTVFDTTGLFSGAGWLKGWLSLQNMAAGDAVTVNLYEKVDGTNFELLDSKSFSDAQAQPALDIGSGSFASIANANSVKLTINQTAGILKAFPWVYAAEPFG